MNCKCVICMIEVNTDKFVYMGSTKDTLGYVVCLRCRDIFDILEDHPTHCRICPYMKPAVCVAWDVLKQCDQLYCQDCLIKTCKSPEEEKILHRVFNWHTQT